MFVEEAIWVGHLVDTLALSTNVPVANLGSSTSTFRKEVQPHIDQYIFQPLESRQVPVVHVDTKNAVGVDRVADITDPGFAREFAQAFQLVLCTNMLEHVEDIQAVANNVFACCQPGGYLMLTVPFTYKKHEDPIDNMFRPTPAEINALFPADKVEEIASEIIVIRDKKYYSKKKSRFPLWGYRDRIGYYLGKKYRVSGILLQVKE